MLQEWVVPNSFAPGSWIWKQVGALKQTPFDFEMLWHQEMDVAAADHK
jgi:hypothetical protein